MTDRENKESRARRASARADTTGDIENHAQGHAEPEARRSVIEMMNGPARPGRQLRATVLWLAIAFIAALFSLTTWVIFANGVNWLALLSLVILGYVLAALAGMLRYKGQDPMAQFDSQLPARRRRGRRGK